MEETTALTTALKSLTDAVRSVISSDVPRVFMTAIVPGTPTVESSPTGPIVITFPLPSVMRPRDIIAISATMTIRSTTLWYYGGAVNHSGTIDQVLLFSDTAAVSTDGKSVRFMLPMVFQQSPCNSTAAGYSASRSLSVINYQPISAVRYHGEI